ncbi:Alpha/Beta hydrolase protein [Cantharellus anzutake]|uniref:Alpha/Beta hydrolase protein n=1 Tax=Cantharellus anzutake TaxID=1750568 RepID=UPI0019034A96|nr:Alpha/Beta hydrolase protein [Cantharellus anzutake]KAF8337612.1 Alpha/Beta hydrolase protein [Cantharellus anzutake]
MTTTASYGKWKSPISATLLTEKTIKFTETHVDPVTSRIYWAESRPAEEGRVVPVTSDGVDHFRDVIPSGGWNARTRVHEYGGAAVAVRNNLLYFSDFKTGRIYRIDTTRPNELPVPVTPVSLMLSKENDKKRFGDSVVHPTQSHILISVLEDHTKGSHFSEVVNALVAINTKAQTVTTLASGADFYSRLKLAFISWGLPSMPWEASRIFFGSLSFSDEGVEFSEPPRAITSDKDLSVSQPQWADARTLFFLSDITGYYNPYMFDALTGSVKEVLTKAQSDEFSEPAWLLGESRYAVLDPTTILAAPIVESVSVLTLIDVPTGISTPVSSDYVGISRLKALSSTEAVFIGTGHTTDEQIVKVRLDTKASPPSASFTILKRSSTLFDHFPSGLISVGLPLAFPPEEGKEGDGPLHVLFTPPKNPRYSAPKGELPPAVVNIHGGPTSRVAPGLNGLAQFFTSRGWAYVSVNYRGSSGYGREYRSRLNGNWGIVDVADSVSAVRLLGARGLIDPNRVAIRGGSSGGYTVLAALVREPDVFSAGTSSYGISDLGALAEDTHKFESGYLFGLLGAETPEEKKDVCRRRSPVYHAENIKAPLLIFQGSVDAVVPPNQAELIIEKIKANGGKYKYVLFEGEGHGWRKAENIRVAYETELAWYEEVFGLGNGE